MMKNNKKQAKKANTRRRLQPKDDYTSQEVSHSRLRLLNFGRELMFPARLRVNGRVAVNINNTFTGAAIQNNYLTVNNPITVISGQNMSGLAWLLSGQETNGTAKAPYVLGIVRQVTVKLYARTATNATGSTGGMAVLFPLSVGTSTNSYTLSNAEEAWGRSNIVNCTSAVDVMAKNKPQVVKSYKLWELAGVSEQEYMNNYALFSFGYAGLLSGVPAIVICLLAGTESASTDASLDIRTDIIIDFEIELFNRNILITSAPPSYERESHKIESQFNRDDKIPTSKNEVEEYELVKVKKTLH